MPQPVLDIVALRSLTAIADCGGFHRAAQAPRPEPVRGQPACTQTGEDARAARSSNARAGACGSPLEGRLLARAGSPHPRRPRRGRAHTARRRRRHRHDRLHRARRRPVPATAHRGRPGGAARLPGPLPHRPLGPAGRGRGARQRGCRGVRNGGRGHRGHAGRRPSRSPGTQRPAGSRRPRRLPCRWSPSRTPARSAAGPSRRLPRTGCRPRSSATRDICAGVLDIARTGQGVALLAAVGPAPDGLTSYEGLPPVTPIPMSALARPGADPATVAAAFDAVRGLLR